MSFLKFINESFDKNYNLGSDRVQKTNKKRLPGKRTKLHESMLDIADKLEETDCQYKLGKKRFPDKCKDGKCTDEVLTEDRDEYTDVIQLVADYFNVPVEDITQSSWDERVYELPDGEEYLVIHENDVYDAVKEDIKGAIDGCGGVLHTFTPNAIEYMLLNCLADGVSDDDMETEEDKNNIDNYDMDEIVDLCLEWDGAAHFLARYDGEEHEIGGPYLAYRQN